MNKDPDEDEECWRNDPIRVEVPPETIKNPRLRTWLRGGFLKIIDATENLDPAPKDQKGRGARAFLRATFDDIDRGYDAIASARHFSRQGLSALERSEYLDRALQYFIAATASLTTGVKKARKSGAFEPTKLRGRRLSVTERNRRLATAVAEQEAAGLKGKEARNTALKQNPDLDAEFDGRSERTLREAVRLGRKLEGK